MALMISFLAGLASQKRLVAISISTNPFRFPFLMAILPAIVMLKHK